MNDIYTDQACDILILGDVNVDLLQPRNPLSRKLSNVLKNCRLVQQINEPMHVTEHSATLIDHVICNRPEMYHINGTLDPGLSDHSLNYASRKMLKISHTTIRVSCRNYRKLDDINFQHDIDLTDWSDILACHDANIAVDLFTKQFLQICETHAPMHTVNFRSNAPAWLTYDYLAHTDEREFLSKLFKLDPTEANKLAKLDSIYRTNDLKQSLQRSYFRDAIAKHSGNMKETWREIKRFWPHLNKSNVRPTLVNDSESNEDLATRFNTFFTNVGSDLQLNIPTVEGPIMDRPDMPPVFEFNTPTLLEIVS